ncbi:MAG: RimK family alpha-L-glutamate ligase [Patescibacteria group bacterium]
MKLLVLTLSGKQSQYEVDRITEESKSLGVDISRKLYKDLSFDFRDQKVDILVDGENLKNYSAIIFRVAGTKSGKYIFARNNIIRTMDKEGIFCLNGRSYLAWPRMEKISQHTSFVLNQIPIIPTQVYMDKETFPEQKMNFPLIAKYSFGFQGKSIAKIDNQDELNSFLTRRSQETFGLWLWQDCIPNQWDIRVIVVGGQTIGAMKRIAKKGDFRSNFSQGGSVENYQLSGEEKQLAEKVAKVSQLDYCGVDIIKDEAGKNYILEVNRACQFKGFEQSTKINVAKTLVEYLISQGKK